MLTGAHANQPANAAGAAASSSSGSSGVVMLPTGHGPNGSPKFGPVATEQSSHLSKSMRLLTGTRLTEIQTPHTILTVQVSERPLEKELKGVKGTKTAPGRPSYPRAHVR